MTRICFVRHGETDWNIAQRMQGHIDLALNANGEAQAVAAGCHFSGLHAAALYSSDLLRARQTAQAISVAMHLPMTLLPALRERNFGRCEGMTFDEIMATNPEDAHAILRRDPDYVTPGGGESLRQHHLRILGCIEGLVCAHIGQTIVVVTHGGVLDVVYCRAHGLPPETPRTYPIPNTGINWVTVQEDQWVIERWGDTAHLE